MRFYGCRFTMLNAISECFTSMGAFNEAPGCEGSLWCGRGLFFTVGIKGLATHAYISLHHVYKCSCVQIVGYPVDMTT